MKKLLFILLCLLIAVSAHAENPLAGKHVGHYQTPTGGTDIAVDGWATPQDGDVAYVFGTLDAQQIFMVYEFESSSSATESGYLNIAPDDATSGRWLQKLPAFFFGTVAPSVTDGVIWYDTSP